jgi:hypothetical protein
MIFGLCKRELSGGVAGALGPYWRPGNITMVAAGDIELSYHPPGSRALSKGAAEPCSSTSAVQSVRGDWRAWLSERLRVSNELHLNASYPSSWSKSRESHWNMVGRTRRRTTKSFLLHSFSLTHYFRSSSLLLLLLLQVRCLTSDGPQITNAPHKSRWIDTTEFCIVHTVSVEGGRSRLRGRFPSLALLSQCRNSLQVHFLAPGSFSKT